MTRIVLRRIAYNAFVLLGVLFVVHGLLLLTGDPAAAYLPLDASAEQVELMRVRLGLDRPFLIQFFDFVGRAVRLDFGESFRNTAPAMEMVIKRIPATLQLGVVGLVFSLSVAVPLGAIAALRRDTWIDRVARAVAALGQAAPSFWVGLVLLLVFGVRLGWLPVSGAGSWRHLILPGIVIALPTVPPIVRLFRSSIIDVQDRDYVRTARSKGLGGWRIFRSHVARNSSVPLVTLISFEISSILSGALIAEVIFAYPGMGRLAYQAIISRDMAVVQAFVVVVSLVVLTTNLLLDLCYAALDPRVRLR